MKKIYGLISVLTVLGFMMAGCNSSSGTGGLGPVDMEALVGKWRIESMKQEGTMRVTTTTPPKDTTTSLNDTAIFSDSTYYTQFKADMTFIANEPSQGLPKSTSTVAVLTGTWSLSGSTLTTIYKSTPTAAKTDTLKSEVGISNSRLTSISHMQKTYSFGGMTYTTNLTQTYTAVRM